MMPEDKLLYVLTKKNKWSELFEPVGVFTNKESAFNIAKETLEHEMIVYKDNIKFNGKFIGIHHRDGLVFPLRIFRGEKYIIESEYLSDFIIYQIPNYERLIKAEP